MRTSALRQAAKAPEAKDRLSSETSSPAPQLLSAQAASRLGHRFENLPVDRARPLPAPGSPARAPLQRKLVWGGRWLGAPEGEEGLDGPPQGGHGPQLQQNHLAQQLPGNNVQQLPGNNVQQLPGNNVQQLPGNNVQQLPGNNVQQLPGNNVQQLPGNNVQQLPPVNNVQQLPPVNNVQQLPGNNDQQPLVVNNDQLPLVGNNDQLPLVDVDNVRQPPQINNQRQLAVNHHDIEANEDEGIRRPLLGNRPRRPSAWNRFKSWVGSKLDSPGANFVSINSPGTQTGVVGGLSGVNSLLTPPKEIPRTSGYLNATGNYTTGIGAGLNALGMGSDLVASAQGIRNMSKEGGLGGFIRGIKGTFSSRRNETGSQAETRSTAKRLAVDLPVNLADASSQGMQMGNAISSLTHAGTSILPSVLGTASAGIGAGVQGIVAARAGWRFGRAWHHKRKVDAIRNDREFGQMSQENQAAANHMSTQLGKRRARSLIGGLGATAGAVGGGLLLGGLLGGAALLTPIGWGLVGAGALVAAGLGIHKLYRHYQKNKAGTLGQDRQRHADNLHNAVVGNHQQNKADALKILRSHGITEDQASDPVKGKQLIRRKLEGW